MSRHLRPSCVWLGLLCGWLGAAPAPADPPAAIAYQGVLLDPAGAPIDGTRTIGVRIWSHALSTSPNDRLYEETHADVAVVDGVFAIALGTGSAPSGAFGAPLFAGADRWLEVVVAGEVLAPRQKILSVPYALQAQQCVDARTLSGQSLAGLVQSGAPGSVSGAMLSEGAVTADKLDLTSLAVGNGTSTTLSVNGFDGTIASGLGGDGLVKGWARINAGGSVASCYRCSTSTADTRLLQAGQYEVDFTPIGADVHSRPWSCTLGTGEVFSNAAASIACLQRAGDPSAIYVAIKDASGAFVNADFTVLLY